jgi:hypothetical protein
MNSKEIVKRAMTFQCPQRIGLYFYPPRICDISTIDVGPAPAFMPRRWKTGNIEKWTDEWGNTWQRLDKFSKGEVCEGALKSWEDLEDYKMPDLGEPARIKPLPPGDKTKFIRGHLPGFPFSIMRKLRKMETFLADLCLYRQQVEDLQKKIVAELTKAIINLADAGADCIFFEEDWGTQDRLLIDPKMWRQIFKPAFAELCGVAHDKGLLVEMHSCGAIGDIIGDLIEVGVNCFQFDQPRLHGIEWLGDNFGGKAAFSCPVDIQVTLQTANRELIEAEARLLIDKLGSYNGGFIAVSYGGNKNSLDAINVTEQSNDWAYEIFKTCGIYNG